MKKPWSYSVILSILLSVVVSSPVGSTSAVPGMDCRTAFKTLAGWRELRLVMEGLDLTAEEASEVVRNRLQFALGERPIISTQYRAFIARKYPPFTAEAKLFNRGLAAGVQILLDALQSESSLNRDFLTSLRRGNKSADLHITTHAVRSFIFAELSHLMKTTLRDQRHVVFISDDFPLSDFPVLDIPRSENSAIFYSDWGELPIPIHVNRVHLTGGCAQCCLLRTLRDCIHAALLWRDQKDFTVILHSSAIWGGHVQQGMDFRQAVEAAEKKHDIALARKIVHTLLTTNDFFTGMPYFSPHFFNVDNEIRWLKNETKGFQVVLTRASNLKTVRLIFAVD